MHARLTIGTLAVALAATTAGAWAATIDMQPELVRQECLNNDLFETAYDCDCVATQYRALHPKLPDLKWRDVLSTLLNSEDVRTCVNPEKIRARSLLKCGMGGYRQNRTFDRKKMGKASFCHCITDATVETIPTTSVKSIMLLASGSGRPNALLKCGKLATYSVPADSIFLPAPIRPIPPIADGITLETNDQTTLLIIVNKNFDLAKLDYARYAVSDAWDNAKPNDVYVTPRENPVSVLPGALVARGAKPPGKIDKRNLRDVPQVAHLYNHAILLRDSQLPELQERMRSVAAISSVDYYVISGDEIYAAPDLSSKSGARRP